jgi:hypothetical protein
MASKTTSKAKTPAKKTKTAAKKQTGAKKAATAKTKQSTAKKAPTSKRSPKRAGATQINPLQRQKMIEVAAYYRAEKRGFDGGDPQDDWYHAEAEVDKLLQTNQIHVS